MRGTAALRRLDDGWPAFVVPGLGVRCVSDQPWVTGAETCELAIALEAAGDRARALEMLEQIQHLRAGDGGYWTGWQFANRAHYPNEQSSWTAAAIVLAADALSGATGGAGVFRDCAAPASVLRPADAAACGCRAAALTRRAGRRRLRPGREPGWPGGRGGVARCVSRCRRRSVPAPAASPRP